MKIARLRPAVQETDQPEVVKAQAAVLHHEDVSGVRVAVEQAHREELVEIRVDQELSQPGAIALNRGIVDPVAAAPFLDEDILCHQSVDGAGDVDLWPVPEGLDEVPDIPRLLAKVGFLAQVRPDLLDDPHRPMPLQARRGDLDEPGGEAQRPHVTVDPVADIRPADLDDHAAPVLQGRPIDHRDRHRRHRLGLELREEVVDLRTEGALHLASGDLAIERARPVLKVAKRQHIVFGQQVSPQAQRLTEFHVGRPERLQRLAQPRWQLWLARWGPKPVAHGRSDEYRGRPERSDQPKHAGISMPQPRAAERRVRIGIACQRPRAPPLTIRTVAHPHQCCKRLWHQRFP